VFRSRLCKHSLEIPPCPTARTKHGPSFQNHRSKCSTHQALLGLPAVGSTCSMRGNIHGSSWFVNMPFMLSMFGSYNCHSIFGFQIAECSPACLVSDNGSLTSRCDARVRVLYLEAPPIGRYEVRSSLLVVKSRYTPSVALELIRKLCMTSNVVANCQAKIRGKQALNSDYG
jgi:hypothetical protein